MLSTLYNTVSIADSTDSSAPATLVSSKNVSAAVPLVTPPSLYQNPPQYDCQSILDNVLPHTILSKYLGSVPPSGGSHLFNIRVRYRCIILSNHQCKFDSRSLQHGAMFATTSPNLSGRFAVSFINIPKYVPEKGIKNHSAVAFLQSNPGKTQSTWKHLGGYVCVCLKMRRVSE